MDETEILLLRRKYFYSDANVDARYVETFLQILNILKHSKPRTRVQGPGAAQPAV